MATVACPGCGLPRAEAELGTPCPVCASAPALPTVPRAPRPAAPAPASGLPADASQLDTPPAAPPVATPGFPKALGAALFLLGACAGVGAVLAVQALTREAPRTETEVVAKPPEPFRPAVEPPAPRPETAPMPRPRVDDPDDDDENVPPPRPVLPLPLKGVTVIDLTHQPNLAYHLPFAMKKGQHVVLKGTVKSFRVTGLDAGATLDASELRAETLYIGGRIDGGSKLKLCAPNGFVQFTARVAGRSEVDVDAPGAEVKFLYATTAAKDGSKIDGGARVSIAARFVEFKGDIGGDGTRVNVALTKNGRLRLANVTGTAVVEYRVAAEGSAPDVTVGSVAPTATFRVAK